MLRNMLLGAGLAAILALGEAPPARAAGGQAAVDALIGNTIFYTSNGEEVWTYFARDGSMKILVSGKRDDSRWKAMDGKLCYKQSDEAYGDCMMIQIEGDNVVMQNEGLVMQAKLLQGNIKDMK